MEPYEISETVVSFGKQLVEQFESRDGGDPLARWLCFHLAAQIEESNRLSDDLTAPIHKECAELILGLWASRAHLPSRLKPFESFEVMAKVIEELRSEQSFFFRSRDEVLALVQASSISQDSRTSLELILVLDDVAKRVFRACIGIVSQESRSELVDAALGLKSPSVELADISAIKLAIEEELEVATEADENEDREEDRSSELLEQISALRESLTVMESLLKERGSLSRL